MINRFQKDDYPNNQQQQLSLTGTNGSSYQVEYTYDAVGNRMEVTDSGNIIRYNYQDGIYQTDPLNRLNSVDRSFDGATYRTAYQYDKAGLLTKIKYPESTSWLEYQYNQQNQLTQVVGFTGTQGITYDANGAVTGISYANGVTASYTYDNNHRVKNYQVKLGSTHLLQQEFIYDGNNNITSIQEGATTKTYDYDDNNQLTRSITSGKFLEQDPTPGSYGLKLGDHFGANFLGFTTINALIGLDYFASSIGIDFGTIQPGVKKILLIPDEAYQTNRILDRTLDLYTSSDNQLYQLIPRSNWEFGKDSQGKITITLKERVATRYLKVHVKFDDRNNDFSPKNKATFLNELTKMLRVYQEATGRTEEYQYDAAGNRKLQRITLIQTTETNSYYYSNSNRLKTDGKYAFTYDVTGNVVEKGNKFTINGDTVTFSVTGEGVEYWHYNYDLLNRLISVTKNGTIVSEYAYDPEGLRVVKKAKGETTHYVFEGTEPIFEKKISTGKTKSYVFALGKHLARVDGGIGDSSAKVYYYHTDYLGSVRVITDQSGKVVFNADYFAFGTKYASNGDFDENHGFTGKEYDSDIGLYYFNARWYDPDLGRFISEDPAADPNNPNLYSYCGNNPVIRSDPSGQFWWIAIGALLGGLNSVSQGGSFWSGAFVGAISGAVSWGVSGALGAGVTAAYGGRAWGVYMADCFASSMMGMTVSGAIGGGIMSAAMGGDFWEGARLGALTGALSWGANQLWGDQLAEWAGDNEFKIATANGFTGGAVSFASGGNFGSGFANSFGNGFLGSMVNRYYPRIGGSSGDFNPSQIKEVVILNDSTNPNTKGQGHTGILFIDQNDRGMYFSYNPVEQTPISAGQMRYKELNSTDVNKLLSNGKVSNVKATDGSSTIVLKKAENYNRFIKIKVSSDNGFEMYRVASDLQTNPDKWTLLTNNCSQIVSDSLKAGGINYSRYFGPNQAFNSFLNKNSETYEFWKLRGHERITDLTKVLEWGK